MSAKRIYFRGGVTGGAAVAGRRVQVRPRLKATYRVGETLPQGYVVDEVIAQGGSGLVLKAHKPKIDPPIYKAVKVVNASSVRSGTSSQAEIEKEFYGEALVSHEIGSDPYAIGVEDIMEMPDGTRALVFPFIVGRTLAQLNRDHIRRGCLVPFELAAFICHRILSVLTHAQERGIAHRDLCANNVMVQRTGVPMLLDWGAGSDVNEGVLVGKPGYLAPEAIRNPGQLDHDAYFKADIFSLGALIRELLTGHNILDPGGDDEDFEAVLDWRAALDTGTLPSVSRTCDDVPEALAEIVSACLFDNPADRPTAQDLYEYMGGKYLYTARIGFGVTAETLEDYLKFFYADAAEDAPLTDDKAGRSLAKVISVKHRRALEDPRYDGLPLKQVVTALRVPYATGSVFRTFGDAYGADAARAARYGLLKALLQAEYGDPVGFSPGSMLKKDYEAALAEYGNASADEGTLLLRRHWDAYTAGGGAPAGSSVEGRVLRQLLDTRGDILAELEE